MAKLFDDLITTDTPPDSPALAAAKAIDGKRAAIFAAAADYLETYSNYSRGLGSTAILAADATLAAKIEGVRQMLETMWPQVSSAPMPIVWPDPQAEPAE